MNDDTPPLAEPMDMGTLMATDAPGLPGQRPAGGQIAMPRFIMTAQPVATRRNPAVVQQRMRALAAMNGMNYVYSWKVTDRTNKRQQLIEGPSVSLARDLAREYGNCFAGVVDVTEEADAWVFTALFVDLETGFNMTEQTRQRKTQKLSMGDAAREIDILFRIGQAKAWRNVVVNALQTYTDYTVAEAKKCLVNFVENNREKANKYIESMCDRFELAIGSVEAVVGNKRDKWTVRDIARVMTELKGIEDGFSRPEELYPSTEDAAQISAEKAAKKQSAKSASKREPQAATPSETAESADSAEPEKKGRGRPKMTEEEKARRKAEREASKQQEPPAAAEPTQESGTEPEAAPEPPAKESPATPSEDAGEADQGEADDDSGWEFD